MSSSRLLIRGTFFLGFRQAAVQLLGIVNGVALASIVSPELFGIYAILTFQFLLQVGIGDLGIGATLLQQKEEPDQPLYRAVHLLRQSVDLLQLGIVWLIAPVLAEWYGLAENEHWYFRIVALAVLLQSFQLVPTIRMERGLEFGRLAAAEVTQAFVFTSLCIGLAAAGMEGLSFPLAWLGYGGTGALLSLILKPWPLGWCFAKERLRKRLGFGLSYQFHSLLGLLRDAFTPVAIGFLLGTYAVGLMNFSQMLALSIALGSLVSHRIAFPYFSKFQDSPQELRKALRLALRLVAIAVLPASAALFVFVEPLLQIVFGEKWNAALPLFYLLWGANLFLPFAGPLTSAFHASGKARTPLVVLLGTTTAIWIIGLPVLLSFGLPGFALTLAALYAINTLCLFVLCQRTVIQVPFLLDWLQFTALTLLSIVLFQSFAL